MNHSEIVSFIWGVADLIRDSFKRGHYQDVILPLTVLRRLDCVLAPTREAVWKANAKWKGKLENPEKQLRKASGFAFYNTSLYDFDKLLGDHQHLAKNLRNYIAGFSANMAEVIEHFGFDNTITEMEKAKLLYKVMERFKNVDLSPENVSNAQMGTIFEELIRKFNEALDENPGEHFTPRDVVRLMVDLLLAGDAARLKREGAVITVCDPDAWINAGVRDEMDGQVGKVGYEINFNRYFYKYVAPRALGEIEKDIRAVEEEIVRMLGQGD